MVMTGASPESKNIAPRGRWSALSVGRNIVFVALVLLLLWLVADILFVIFGGILLAVLLRGLSDWLSRHTGLPMGWSLAVVIVTIVVIVSGVDYFITPRVSHEFDELFQQIPVELQQVENQLGQSSWGKAIIQELHPGDCGDSVRAAAGRVFGVATTIFAIVTDIIIILFIGIYSAAEPETYVAGIVYLSPFERRDRIRQVLYEMGHTLRWWLIGRIISMLAIAVTTVVGLWLIGVPLAFPLALLAGMLSFVPYIGSISSAIPSMLIAMTQSTTLVLYVIMLYLFIHLTEGYILVPLMQKKMVHLPPALTLSMQAILGTILGILGIALATPLTAAAIVAVRMLYIEDVLHDTHSTKAIE